MKEMVADLHCHLLPGIDDGAKNIDISLELLRREQEQGVNAVVFTPHFYYERTTLREFAEKRNAAYRQTAVAAQEKGLHVMGKLGAEVYFSMALPNLDLRTLAFGGTDYLLIELPTSHLPGGVDDTLYEIMQQGFTPILAHVERYAYVEKNPRLLYDWVSMGALAQINAAAVLDGGAVTRQIKKYLKWNLIHIMASDAHSLQRRPPNLQAGYDALLDETVRYFQENAQAIFEGKDIHPPEPMEPRQVMGFWV